MSEILEELEQEYDDLVITHKILEKIDYDFLNKSHYFVKTKIRKEIKKLGLVTVYKIVFFKVGEIVNNKKLKIKKYSLNNKTNFIFYKEMNYCFFRYENIFDYFPSSSVLINLFCNYLHYGNLPNKIKFINLSECLTICKRKVKLPYNTKLIYGDNHMGYHEKYEHLFESKVRNSQKILKLKTRITKVVDFKYILGDCNVDDKNKNIVCVNKHIISNNRFDKKNRMSINTYYLNKFEGCFNFGISKKYFENVKNIICDYYLTSPFKFIIFYDTYSLHYTEITLMFPIFYKKNIFSIK